MHYYTEEDFQRMLADYPEEVTKEQLYRLCHVSKRVATFYLAQGFMPCKRRDTKTHRYIIKTADIVEFIKKRQENPSAFRVPAGTSRQPVDAAIKKKPLAKESPINLASWKEFLFEALADYPDVCSVQEVIWICGYSKETVFKWCAKEKFTCFNINRKYHIPKKSFIDFMATAEFTTIVQKQRKHLELLSKFEQWEEQCP